MSAFPRLDVRKCLLRRGWVEDADSFTLLRKAGVTVSVNGGDVFVTGPGRYGGHETFHMPNGISAKAVSEICNAWACVEAGQ